MPADHQTEPGRRHRDRGHRRDLRGLGVARRALGQHRRRHGRHARRPARSLADRPGRSARSADRPARPRLHDARRVRRTRCASIRPGPRSIPPWWTGSTRRSTWPSVAASQAWRRSEDGVGRPPSRGRGVRQHRPADRDGLGALAGRARAGVRGAVGTSRARLLSISSPAMRSRPDCRPRWSPTPSGWEAWPTRSTRRAGRRCTRSSWPWTSCGPGAPTP